MEKEFLLLIIRIHLQVRVTQISLAKAYDTSSFTIDGRVNLPDLDSNLDQPRGIAFSASGLKMYIGDDDNDDDL